MFVITNIRVYAYILSFIAIVCIIFLYFISFLYAYKVKLPSVGGLLPVNAE
ncbi:hypothetical protein SAMN04488574_11015 [Bacillus sp. 71mf]|nr:hypothetical protein SAMN04488574_11015 [Bacillus sp. 71mf]SFT02310.1 hypothetical protein SAMN04488145_107121 [Bacillus sp. 103mf]